MSCDHNKRFKGVLFTTNGCLACELEKMISECKRLEAEREGYKNGQMQLQNIVNDLMDTNAKWAIKVKELEVSMILHFQKEHLEGDGPEIDRWKRRVKELEDNIPDPEWCCEKHKAKLVARIKELKEGIEEIIESRYINASTYDAKLKKLIEKDE